MADDVLTRAIRAEAAMRALLANEDLPEPDEVEQDLDSEEIVLLWHEPKVAVVIELWDDGDKMNVPDYPV
jgi:hypothetical protein